MSAFDSEANRLLPLFYSPDDVVEFRTIEQVGKGEQAEIRQYWCRASEAVTKAKQLQTDNSAGFNVYVGINPRKAIGGTKTADVALARFVAVDVDDGCTIEQFDFSFGETGLPAPTLTMNSGGGLWALWKLDEPLLDLKQWTAVQKGIFAAVKAAELSADKSIHDPPRVMRVPGFINHKYPDKPVARIIRCEPDRVYPISEFDFPTVLEAPSAKVSKPESQPVVLHDENDIQKAILCLPRLSQKRCDNYGDWMRVGMVLHTLGDCPEVRERLFKLFDEWSRKSDKYKADEIRGQWDKFSAEGNSNGRLDLGSLIQWAREDSDNPAFLADGLKAGRKPAAATAAAFTPFPVDAGLPAPLPEIVTAAANGFQCDPMRIISPMLSTVAAAVGSTVKLKMREGWEQLPTIWTASISESGTGKSHPFEWAVRPLRERDDANLKEWKAEMDDYEAAYKKWDADVKSPSVKKMGCNLKRPDKPAPCQRHHTSDVTLAALQGILTDSSRGIVVACDELSGWLNGMDQFTNSRGADLPKWLELYNGQGTKVDRKGGGASVIPRTVVAVTGNFTTNAWRKSMRGENVENGLAPRFLASMPPVEFPRWSNAGVPDSTTAAYRELVTRLLNCSGSRELTLSPEAVAAWTAWYDSNQQRRANTTDGYLRSIYSKLPGQLASIAVVFHCVGNAHVDAVDGETMQRAIVCLEWFRVEAERMRAMTKASGNAERLLCYLVDQGGAANRRDVYRALNISGDEADAAMAALVEQGNGRCKGKNERGRKGAGVIFEIVR